MELNKTTKKRIGKHFEEYLTKAGSTFRMSGAIPSKLVHNIKCGKFSLKKMQNIQAFASVASLIGYSLFDKEGYIDVSEWKKLLDNANISEKAQTSILDQLEELKSLPQAAPKKEREPGPFEQTITTLPETKKRRIADYLEHEIMSLCAAQTNEAAARGVTDVRIAREEWCSGFVNTSGYPGNYATLMGALRQTNPQPFFIAVEACCRGLGLEENNLLEKAGVSDLSPATEAVPSSLVNPAEGTEPFKPKDGKRRSGGQKTAR